MKGFWHLPAIAIVASFISIISESFFTLIIYFCWILYLFFQKRLKPIHTFVTLTFLFLSFFFIPRLDFLIENNDLLNESTLQTKITSPPLITNKYLRLIVTEVKSKDKIIIYYFFNDEKHDKKNLKSFKYGATCIINSSLRIPEKNTNPGQFNYQKYLLQQGISFESILESLDQITCSGSNLLSIIFSIRNNLLQFTTKLLSVNTASWLNALVLGDSSLLEDEVQELFNRWSISHILAISGLHVGLVTGLLYTMLVRFSITTKETAQWIIIVFLPIYALLAGGAPSVLRASVMGTIFLLLAKGKIKLSALDVLSITFISLVFFDAYILYHVGFQFSFLVTFGLLLSRNWFNDTKSPFWQLVKISFISQMIVIPLQLQYFYFFQPLSVIINSIIVPYFSLFVIPAMFLLLLFSPLFPKFALIFDNIFSKIHTIVLHILDLFDATFHYPWVIGTISKEVFFLYYVLLFFFMIYLERKKKIQSLYFGTALVVLLIIISLIPYLSSKGYVTMLDIGQGDAYVIELPYRKGTVLIDAGATFSFEDFEPSKKNFTQIIQPYFYSRGIPTIDSIIITHEDLDHNGSVFFILEEMKVKEVIVSQYYEFSEREISAIVRNKVKVKRVKEGDVFFIKNYPFKVLSPSRNYGNSNDNSLVVMTTLGERNWLFTGDISKEVEREILSKYGAIKIDVIKIAHHGSKTSTDELFIENTKPKYSLISVGRNNRFGHPAKEVLETLQNTKIFRTDIHGAVQYIFHRGKGSFKTYLQKPP